MTQRQFTPEESAAFRRFVDHLPRENDVTLLVLKGHLLIEERLFAMLERSVRHPQHLREANLRTGQLIALAKALYWRPDHAWRWHMVSSLNRMRNQLAHRLEPREMQVIIKDFLKPLELRVPGGLATLGDTVEGRLRAGLSFLYGTFLG